MVAPRKTAARKSAAPDPFANQQELTPVTPVASPVADAAREAIATINTQLSEFDKVEAGLGTLEQRYARVAYTVDTKKGMEDAVLARREIKGVRVAVEHARRTAKAPILALGRNIDDRALKITERLLVIEDPIDDQIKAQEKKEADRKAELERRVAEIRNTPRQCIGKSGDDLQQVLDGLNSLPLPEFAEYREEAAKAQFEAMQAVQTLLTQARQAEELAAMRERDRKEQARKDAINQAIAAIGAPLQQLAMCRTSARVQGLIDNVEAVEIAEVVYQEFAAAAREKKAAVLAELVRVRDEKKEAEDARAAAAAAPPPTPALTPQPTPAPTPVAPALASSHDQVNDESAAALHRTFAPLGAVGGPVGRSLESDFARVMRGPVVDADPFSAPAPAPVAATTELLSISTARPSDAEILSVLAEHYEVDHATAASWLRNFDAAAALAQQSLLPTGAAA